KLHSGEVRRPAAAPPHRWQRGKRENQGCANKILSLQYIKGMSLRVFLPSCHKPTVAILQLWPQSGRGQWHFKNLTYNAGKTA
ncbi:hypothetical protein, partial [uncultured Eubacterium sp.]|uniref:hypothetical protein n=1 Tax=uncultured Eubacterium sp. TaxID=165185 RepID=UPI00259225A2